MIFNPNDYPTVFLSYDEPNCESNYQHLLSLNPNALRIHGVKGSDSAHKAVANLVKDFATNVIIVDGDNIVKWNFYQNSYELSLSDITDTVLSFSTYNIVNGNVYGNGGIKVWPVSLLQSMQTHEHSTNVNVKVDFDLTKYVQINTVGSEIAINSSPQQAFRAGFREGIKLLLNDGEEKYSMLKLDWRNYDRLWRWMHVGQDVENGIYCIYGARYACYLLKVEKSFDIIKVNDFTYLNDLFSSLTINENECNRLGKLLNTIDYRIQDILVDYYSSEYRNRIVCIKRSPEPNTIYDIVFIHNNEIGAEENFNKVKERFPRTKILSGYKGIHNAHIQAAKMCQTDYFWVIDGDAIIVDDFDFVYDIPFYEQPKVRVFRAKNPINGLVYGHGGVKLLPRTSVLRMRTDNVDMTTSISEYYEPVMILSNIHQFNTDAYSTYRTAFRECCKLASEVIKNQNSTETQDRLNVWCTLNDDASYGYQCYAGALAGREYGLQQKDLHNINNYEWLKNKYDEFQQHTLATHS